MNILNCLLGFWAITLNFLLIRKHSKAIGKLEGAVDQLQFTMNIIEEKVILGPNRAFHAEGYVKRPVGRPKKVVEPVAWEVKEI